MDQPLLILDLDETLVYGTLIPLDRPPDLMVDVYGIYRRPHFEQFIASVCPLFRLALWSAASRSYAAAVANYLFPPEVRLEFLWCRERCTHCHDPETHEEYWVKDLKKLRRLGYDLDRVLFVDNTPRNLERNYGNYVRIQPYGGSPDDMELLWLAKYLVQIAQFPNLRSVEKQGWRQNIGQ